MLMLVPFCIQLWLIRQTIILLVVTPAVSNVILNNEDASHEKTSAEE